MVSFSEMKYERPDVEGLKAALRDATERVAQAKSYEEVRWAFFDVQDKMDGAFTLFSIAHVRNTMNTTDEFYDGEVSWLREQMAWMTPLSIAWKKALACSPFRKDFEAEFGSQLFRLLDAELQTEDEKIVPELLRLVEFCQQ